MHLEDENINVLTSIVVLQPTWLTLAVNFCVNYALTFSEWIFRHAVSCNCECAGNENIR